MAKPEAEAERVAYKDQDGDIWVGVDDKLLCVGNGELSYPLETVSEQFGPLTQVPIPEHLR